MSRYKLFIFSVMCLSGVISLLSIDSDAMAVNYVSGASINGHVGQPGHTQFKVNLHWTSACSGSNVECVQVDGKFPCIEHGDDYTDSVCSNREWKTSSSGGWDFYEVILYPCDSNEQNMQGTYKVRHKKKLKAYAKYGTGDNDYLNGGDTIDTDSVWSGGNASVSSANYNPTGYTWSKWGTGGVCADAGTSRSCTVSNMSSNHTVNAYYKRNHFKGRARVYEGGSISGTAAASTGYVDSDNTQSAEMECINSGCRATYDMYLKTVYGGGATTFTGTGYANGTWLHQSPYAPSSDGTKMREVTQTFRPGESYCKHITFRPYGTLSNTATRKAEVCMKAKESYFQGKVDVGNQTTNWMNTNSKVTYNISNCSPTTGCTAKFTHYLRRTSGIGSTAYAIDRTSNLWVSTKSLGVAPGAVKSGTYDPSANNTATNLQEATQTLYPGMVVCERLTFKPSNDTTVTVNNTVLTGCASALGNAQPPDPGHDPSEDPNTDSGDLSFINIRVRNADVTKWSNFQREVYAKPGNHIIYRANYNPVLQYTYYLKPEQMRINGGTVYPSSTTVNTTSTLANMFNSKKPSSLYDWNNGYSVKSEHFASGIAAYNHAKVLTLGDTTRRQEVIPNASRGSYLVVYSDVGKSLNEIIKTNNGTSVNDSGASIGRSGGDRTTPKQVSFSNNGNKNLGNVDTASISETAFARIPYNFRTTGKIDTPDNTPIYAGEQTSVSYHVDVLPRENPETTNSATDKYATKVDDAAIKLIVYYPGAGAGPHTGSNGWPASGGSKSSDLCSYYGLPNNQTTCGMADVNTSTTLNSNGDLAGEIGKTKSTTFQAQDLSAGSRVCVAVANYPATSGDYKNWSDKEGDHKWQISDSVCYTIAKRPSIQVWGGNLYSKGKIQTGVSVKNNVAGVTPYSVGSRNGSNYVFGSFSELGVASSSTVTGFASAGSTGYTRNGASGELVPNPFAVNSGLEVGGSLEPISSTTICKRGRLTFANTACSGNGPLGLLGNSISASAGDRDKSAVVAKFGNPGEPNAGGAIVIDGGKDYYYSKEDLTVAGANNVTTGVHIVQSDKTIRIAADLSYSGSYKSFVGGGSVPKIVIYANNIIIDCNVKRIDGLLIANETIKTCDSDNIKSPANSHQLIINGAVVAKGLIANRTYGAARGANSIVPAEIINFDPTLYLWGGDDESDATSADNGANNLDVTYIHEVPARR